MDILVHRYLCRLVLAVVSCPSWSDNPIVKSLQQLIYSKRRMCGLYLLGIIVEADTMTTKILDCCRGELF